MAARALGNASRATPRAVPYARLGNVSRIGVAFPKTSCQVGASYRRGRSWPRNTPKERTNEQDRQQPNEREREQPVCPRVAGRRTGRGERCLFVGGQPTGHSGERWLF